MLTGNVGQQLLNMQLFTDYLPTFSENWFDDHGGIMLKIHYDEIFFMQIIQIKILFLRTHHLVDLDFRKHNSVKHCVGL